jgi:hypothetical protein
MSVIPLAASAERVPYSRIRELAERKKRKEK